jgi:hypothetical protein
LIVYFEVPNGGYILRDQACWELIYQHFSYFTERSLVTLFRFPAACCSRELWGSIPCDRGLCGI